MGAPELSLGPHVPPAPARPPLGALASHVSRLMHPRSILTGLALLASLGSLVDVTAAQSFTKPGMYMIQHAGWQRKTTPAGDVFTCSVCDAQIQIQIEFVPLPKDEGPRTNEQFIASLESETDRRAFADAMMRRSIPVRSGFSLTIEQTGITKVGGIDAIQFAATVALGRHVTRDTSMLAIHRSRLVKVTLNYFDGALTEKARAAIDSFFGGLQFI